MILTSIQARLHEADLQLIQAETLLDGIEQQIVAYQEAVKKVGSRPAQTGVDATAARRMNHSSEWMRLAMIAEERIRLGEALLYSVDIRMELDG